jgi:hypothetical protein
MGVRPSRASLRPLPPSSRSQAIPAPSAAS